MPYLSFLAINYDIQVIAEVQKWFESVIVRNYANPHAEHQIMLSEDADIQKRILRFLNDMDIDISGYRYDEEDEQLYIIRSIHGENFELPFSEESEGTKKLIAALPVILVALLEGRPVIIDELDAKLHPKLLRYIISLFKNKQVNQKGAQLIFTSHDMTTLKNTVFRRDEIWFAALNDTHSSEIYSLYEIRREDNERVKDDKDKKLVGEWGYSIVNDRAGELSESYHLQSFRTKRKRAEDIEKHLPLLTDALCRWDYQAATQYCTSDSESWISRWSISMSGSGWRS